MKKDEKPVRAKKDAYYTAQALARATEAWLKDGALAHAFAPFKGEPELCKVCGQLREYGAHEE